MTGHADKKHTDPGKFGRRALAPTEVEAIIERDEQLRWLRVERCMVQMYGAARSANIVCTDQGD